MAYVADISDWQDFMTDDDFLALEMHGVVGVIVKFTEGTERTECYRRFVGLANKHNMAWGAYCYSHAQTTERAKEEAKAFLDTVEEVMASTDSSPSLGMWIDIEAKEVIGQDREDVTANASAWIVECNKKYPNYEAGIYASLNTYIEHLAINELAGYVPYWCSQYNDECNFDDEEYFPNKTLRLWQYTKDELIGGHRYDMNILFSDYDELE